MSTVYWDLIGKTSVDSIMTNGFQMLNSVGKTPKVIELFSLLSEVL